ncbi:MAG: hypothetical protein PW845_01195 [Pseudomonas sp.]|uniref:hypothetical protein n=1 Tax=Pseudomonas abieticivorans TaxID=2931382 RepID=UPI0020BDD085|nr:hypothetical protein [Pseudomonas sp. PIA16]MDE1164011.1 hypothetical protein [Pseudomonas sp.]
MIELPGLTLEFLDADPATQALCLRYWRADEEGRFVEKMVSICSDAGLTQAQLRQVVRQHARVWSRGLDCSRCVAPVQFASRTDFVAGHAARAFVCDTCMVTARKDADGTKQRLLQEGYERAMAAADSVEELSARHCLLLLALFKFAGFEQLTAIRAYAGAGRELLSPSRTFDLALIDELWKAGVIAVGPQSPLEAITLQRDGGATFDFERVHWAPTVRYDAPFAGVYEQLDARVSGATFAEGHMADIAECCQELACVECLAFLEAVLGEYAMGYSPGDKTRAVLAKALEHYSVAQVCNFLWRSAKDAAAYQVRSGVSKSHAARTVVGSVERYMEKAQANGWEVARYRRNYRLPQSILSRVIYNGLLATDDGGFSELNSVLLERYRTAGAGL